MSTSIQIEFPRELQKRNTDVGLGLGFWRSLRFEPRQPCRLVLLGATFVPARLLRTLRTLRARVRGRRRSSAFAENNHA